MDGVGKQLHLTNISLSKDGGKSAKVTDIAPGHPGSQEEAASRWRCPHERAVQAQASPRHCSQVINPRQQILHLGSNTD